MWWHSYCIRWHVRLVLLDMCDDRTFAAHYTTDMNGSKHKSSFYMYNQVWLVFTGQTASLKFNTILRLHNVVVGGWWSLIGCAFGSLGVWRKGFCWLLCMCSYLFLLRVVLLWGGSLVTGVDVHFNTTCVWFVVVECFCCAIQCEAQTTEPR